MLPRLEEDQKVFQTNVFGALTLARAVLPSMRAQRSGTIVFISSMAAWVGSATMGAYAASKAAMSIYAEALRDEVAEFGIQVGAIEPGGFRSNLLSSKNMKGPSNRIQDYDKSKLRTTETHVSQLDQNQPGDVAKGVKIMVDIITGTGMAEGKCLPGRLIVGSDAYEMIRSVCETHIRTFDNWKDVIIQTDHE
jgi:NAD(P)-dependent dehydrogenase (short-subunit alcohol dehydrogenase family)